MKLDTGIKELENIEEQFLSGEIPINHVRTLVSSTFFNNLPSGVLHPSDKNEIGRIANSLSGAVELIEFCELPENYKCKISVLIKKAKEEFKNVHQNYPKRAKNWPNENST